MGYAANTNSIGIIPDVDDFLVGDAHHGQTNERTAVKTPIS